MKIVLDKLTSQPVLHSHFDLGNNLINVVDGNLVFSGTQKIIGGTATTSDLSLQTTSGVGATGADMHFLVGNNGATEAMTILNNGNVGIGTTGPASALEVVRSSGASQIETRSTDSSNRAFLQVENDAADVWEFNVWGSAAAGTLFGINRATLAELISNTDTAIGPVTSNFLAFGTNNLERVRIKNSGNVGIGVTSPTAVLHLKAGTATASTAPLKFTSGTLNTVAEAGAIEFLTDDYYATITTGAARKKILLGNGVNFGPGAVSSITVVDGIVTAIS